MSKKVFLKTALMTYTVLVVGVAILFQLRVLEASQYASAQAPNNCCNESDFRSCTTSQDWEAGFYACSSGQCNKCRAASTPNNGVCEPGESHSSHPNDCDSNGNNVGSGGGNNQPSTGTTANGVTYYSTLAACNAVHGACFDCADCGGFYIPQSSSYTCRQSAFRLGEAGRCTVISQEGCFWTRPDGSMGEGKCESFLAEDSCTVSSVSNIYYCPGEMTLNAAGCSRPAPAGFNKDAPQCGLIQIDGLYNCNNMGVLNSFHSYVDFRGCVSVPQPVVGDQPQPEQPAQPRVVQCNELCDTNNTCEAGLVCHDTADGNRCRLPANLTSPTCTPLQANPNLEIEKVVTGGNYNYQIGDLVQFTVTVRNTGDTTLFNVYFADTYNHNFSFASLTGRRGNSAPVSLIGLPGVTINDNARSITVSNLASTELLGSLAPGQEYTLQVNFIARAASDASCPAPTRRACNYASVVSGGMQDSDNDCACVGNISTDL